MNFSDETVEKVQAIIDANRKFEGTALHAPEAQAALQSLTLADLMGVDGAVVTEAVSLNFENALPEITLEAPQGTSFFAGKYIIIPFTEPKQ